MRPLALIGLLAAIALGATVEEAAAQTLGVPLAQGATQTFDHHGICRIVTNSCTGPSDGPTIMIPVGTSASWTDFATKKNPASCITVNACLCGASSGLVGNWKLDEAAGVTASDSVGTNNGTLPGGGNTPVWQPAGGRINGALQFDGNDYVDFGVRDLGNNFTISFWLNPNSTDVSIQGVFANSAQNCWRDGIKIIVGLAANGKNMLGEFGNSPVPTGCNGLNYAGGPASITDSWNHYAVAFDRGAGTAIVYINGVDSMTDTATITDYMTNSDWRMGSVEGGTGASLTGYIDDFRIYNRTLDALAINDMYSGAAQCP